jgi:hypothetical protein
MAASAPRPESPPLEEEFDSIPYHITPAARLLPVSLSPPNCLEYEKETNIPYVYTAT